MMRNIWFCNIGYLYFFIEFFLLLNKVVFGVLGVEIFISL